MIAWMTVSAGLVLAWSWLYTRSTPSVLPSRAYVLTNKVTHARLLPVDAKHAFTYPTLALLVSLDALERFALDIPISLGWGPPLFYIFRFGSIWRTLLGLRGKGYLARQHPASTNGIRAKLDRILLDHGVITAPSQVRDVWMLTMPAVCAFEGINPLTIYYCYRPSGEVSVVVLEVHNTFGEGHVYVLHRGKYEDPTPPKGYDHQWTLPRRFFVSPFNDRSGLYSIALKLPSHPPFDLAPCNAPNLPSIRVHLRTPDPAGALKLIAHLTPQRAAALTRLNLLAILARYPLALLATMPRILYQAWILHYRIRLPIVARPEPFPAMSPRESDAQQSPPPREDGECTASARDHPGGIIYQTPTLLERYARQRALTFLEQRCEETGISVELISGDPSTQTWRYPPRDADDLTPTLTIRYTSPRVFTLFLLAPSAQLFLYTGCKSKTDGQCPVFSVSDEDTYMRVFEVGHNTKELGWIERMTRRMRCVPIPRDILLDCAQPLFHPLAVLRSSRVTRLLDLFVVSMLVIQDLVLEALFAILWVRFEVGTEPWMRDIWSRACRNDEL